MRIADRVSYAIGTWQNIVVWIILVGTWFALGPYLANHSLLPAWFTSNNFNFPLNTVTTIAELYIGFLVGASTNAPSATTATRPTAWKTSRSSSTTSPRARDLATPARARWNEYSRTKDIVIEHTSVPAAVWWELNDRR